MFDKIAYCECVLTLRMPVHCSLDRELLVHNPEPCDRHQRAGHEVSRGA